MAKSNRKETRPRSEPPRRRRWHDDLAPETKQSVLAVVFFALAAISLLAHWGRAGFLGAMLFRALTFAVGKAYFLVPVTLVLTGSSLLFALRRRLIAANLVGGVFFFAMGLALIELFFGERTGGWIGFAVNWPLERFLDFWAAFIVEAAIMVAAVLIMANIPLWTPRREEEAEKGEPGPADRALGAVGAAVAGIREAIKTPEPAPAGGVTVEAVGRARAGENGEEFAVAKKQSRRGAYVLPPLHLLNDDRGTPSSGDIRANANIIKRTLLNFGVDVEMGEVSVGPTVTQYTLKPAEGVKLSRISALHNDLSLALAAHPIRIEAPIPGKSLVGIEVPNRSIALVGLRSLLENDIFQKSVAPLLFALGRDVAGAPVYANLTRMPHLLVAGATGSGKSVAIHSLITALLYRSPPDLLKFLIVDPKRVELAAYNGIPHLLAPPITDVKKTIAALRWAVREMERRYEALARAGVRDIAGYNERFTKNGSDEEPMPYLVIIIDELADLMVSFPREVESSIIRLAQMARAVGIHLVVATQRPSVEVITGLIKANITSRIAFQVASQVDSRTILDAAGAEKLLGNGDMLFLAGDTARPRRIQGGFVSEEEVSHIVKFILDQADAAGSEAAEEDIFAATPGALTDAMADGDEFDGDEDPLYDAAKDTVVKAGKASASYLQRRLKIGYARAARLLDTLEERGVIGPGEGAKPREILMKEDGEGA
ncbi:MAG: DNA translocase FtsK [Candidatus Sungbacteria bacterium]|uniref:DNA translocase FtsK n=1 Tax=Candidatus Sungiibacteriota bacterium TaxID=2750080 RepID=A0A932YXX9_9BACT|nr:DNA translocase FtsK [Candidatus Sungbacteria bacterium]